MKNKSGRPLASDTHSAPPARFRILAAARRDTPHCAAGRALSEVRGQASARSTGRARQQAALNDRFALCCRREEREGAGGVDEGEGEGAVAHFVSES